MYKTAIKFVIGVVGGGIFSWIIIFGFVKEDYSWEWSKTTNSTPSEINAFISNPNFFPLWMKNFKTSRKVRDTVSAKRNIFLIEIEDEEENFQVIFIHDQKSAPDTIYQTYEHPFYNINVEIITQKEETDKTHFFLNLQGRNFAHRLLSPFFFFSVLQDYKEHYDKAFDKMSSGHLKRNAK
ncbi:MAG: hypothetical protein GVY20_11250 [Bacteroidetes bacterium]|jgi:hypothetical protein|nr:hypothetical protein [Bacteroidota bacterium]